MFVRPMRRVTGNMMAFRADPENPDRIIAPSARADEIGVAERELATMQSELASMLHQKSRLAALGLAVSKINHDLRNLLASAQLFSDRLANLPDPTVQRFAPKLMRALERAIAFCQSTLSYGRLQEPPPERRQILLEPLVEEVHETLNLGPDAPMRWISAVERGLIVEADYDQLFRILLNLARNAVQAMESRAARDPGRDQIRITGRREGAVVVIEVSDTGPGFSEKARDHLFEAFQGSTRTGGTGLGLAIAAELVRAHGGEIRLVEGTIGATLTAHHPRPRRRTERAPRRPRPGLRKFSDSHACDANYRLAQLRFYRRISHLRISPRLSRQGRGQEKSCASGRPSRQRFQRRQRPFAVSLAGRRRPPALANKRRSL